MAGSVNVGMFIAFRFVAGASAFMILAAVPILMNEIVPVHLRGALVDVHAVMLVLGYTIQGKPVRAILRHLADLRDRLGRIWLLLLEKRRSQHLAATHRDPMLLAPLPSDWSLVRA